MQMPDRVTCLQTYIWEVIQQSIRFSERMAIHWSIQSVLLSHLAFQILPFLFKIKERPILGHKNW